MTPLVVDRPDLPDTLQVGLSASCAGIEPEPQLVAEFDYIRFSVPKSIEDFTR
ncbi:MAG: hypothetical protein O3C40_23465 [Planctomycetota bacterium]|nr:hypothetical protein [Planctomycetota bacterium]